MKTYSEFLQLDEMRGKNQAKRDAYAQKQIDRQKPGAPGVRVPNNRPPAVGKAGKKERVPTGGALALRPKPGGSQSSGASSTAPGPQSRSPKQKTAQKPNNVRKVGLGRTQAQIKNSLEDRKSGVKGGIKSALGGDMFMKKRKGDSAATRSQIDKNNKQARGNFAKKTAGKIGSGILSTAKRVGAPSQGASQSASGRISAGPTKTKYTA